VSKGERARRPGGERQSGRMFLGVLLLVQLFLLGFQVRRPDAGGVLIVRQWSAEAILPVERASQRVVESTRNFYQSYLALRQVHQQNQALQAEVARLELQNQQLREAARELPKMDALLGFRRSYGMKTEAAQVISGGASADAQAVYLDRGSNAGLGRNMAVITPEGVVGKLSQVLSTSAQVLLVTDFDSGVGALIGNAGVHGLLRGLGAGRVELRNILKDEPVTVGEAVVTSGEDQVYPKGLPIGTVWAIQPSTDGVFKTAQVKLAANLGELEQVLVVTGSLPPSSEQPQAGLTAAEVRQALLPGLPNPPAGLAPANPPQPGVAPAPPNTPPAEGDALGGGSMKQPSPVAAKKKPALGPGGGGPGHPRRP